MQSGGLPTPVVVVIIYCCLIIYFTTPFRAILASTTVDNKNASLSLFERSELVTLIDSLSLISTVITQIVVDYVATNYNKKPPMLTVSFEGPSALAHLSIECNEVVFPTKGFRLERMNLGDVEAVRNISISERENLLAFGTCREYSLFISMTEIACRWSERDALVRHSINQGYNVRIVDLQLAKNGMVLYIGVPKKDTAMQKAFLHDMKGNVLKSFFNVDFGVFPKMDNEGTLLAIPTDNGCMLKDIMTIEAEIKVGHTNSSEEDSEMHKYLEFIGDRTLLVRRHGKHGIYEVDPKLKDELKWIAKFDEAKYVSSPFNNRPILKFLKDARLLVVVKMARPNEDLRATLGHLHEDLMILTVHVKLKSPFTPDSIVKIGSDGVWLAIYQGGELKLYRLIGDWS